MQEKSNKQSALLQSQLSDLETLCANLTSKDVGQNSWQKAEDSFLNILEKISYLKPSKANAISEAFLFLSKLERIYRPKFSLNNGSINYEYAELEAEAEKTIEENFKNDPILLTRHLVNHLKQEKPRSPLDQAMLDEYTLILKAYVENEDSNPKKSYNLSRIAKIMLDAEIYIKDVDFKKLRKTSLEEEIQSSLDKPRIDPEKQEEIKSYMLSAQKLWDDALYQMAIKTVKNNEKNNIAEHAAQGSSDFYVVLLSDNLECDPKNVFTRYSSMLATAPDKSDAKYILIKGAFEALRSSLNNASARTSREERHIKTAAICKDFDREISEWYKFNLSDKECVYFEKEKAALSEFRALLEQEKNLFETGDIDKGIEYVDNINTITEKISNELHGTAVCSAVVDTLFDINESKEILMTSAEQTRGKNFKNKKTLDKFAKIAEQITEQESLLNISVSAAVVEAADTEVLTI